MLYFSSLACQEVRRLTPWILHDIAINTSSKRSAGSPALVDSWPLCKHPTPDSSLQTSYRPSYPQTCYQHSQVCAVKPYWRTTDDISPSYISSYLGYHLVKIILNMCSLVLEAPLRGVQSARVEILPRSVTKKHYYYTKQNCRSPGSTHLSGLTWILTNFKEHLFCNSNRPILRQTKVVFSAMIYKIVNTVRVHIYNIKICHF